MIAQEHISAGRAQTRGQFISFRIVAAVTAATAAFASATLSLPVCFDYFCVYTHHITVFPH
jgi:hypothetical protein